MKIAIIGEIHPEGWKKLEKFNFKAFEIVNTEENNLKKELEDVDGIIIRAAPNLSSDILKAILRLSISSLPVVKMYAQL